MMSGVTSLDRAEELPGRPAATHAGLRPPALHSIARLAARRPALSLGFVIVGTMVAIVVAGPAVYGTDPYAQKLVNRLLPPAWMHDGARENPLGTDVFGRDVLSRLVHGGRISLAISVAAILLGGGLGTLLGLLAGYFGGHLDRLVMRLADAQQALPSILLGIVIVAVTGANLSNLVLVLAISGWALYTRITYGIVRSIKEREFVVAARVTGAGDVRILLRHIQPQIWNPLIVTSTIQVGRMIQIEAALSYLGLGVPPPIPSWGSMLLEGQRVLFSAPWIGIVPGVTIAVMITGVNLLGEGLRQWLDPHDRTV